MQEGGTVYKTQWTWFYYISTEVRQIFYSVARRPKNLIKVKHLISSSITDQYIAAVMKPDLSCDWQAVPASRISRWVWMVEFHDKSRNLAVTLTSRLCRLIDTAQSQATENSILCQSAVIGLRMFIFEKQDVWEITSLMPIEVSTASLLTSWNVFPELLPSIQTWGALFGDFSPSLLWASHLDWFFISQGRARGAVLLFDRTVMVSTLSCYSSMKRR